MSSQENIRIVQKAYQGFVSGNIPAILASLDEGVDRFIPGPKQVIPFAGKRRGPQEVAQFFSELATSLSAIEFEPQEYIRDTEKAHMHHQAWTSEGAVIFITVDGAWDVNWVGNPPGKSDLNQEPHTPQ